MEYKLRDVMKGLDKLGLRFERINHHCHIYSREGYSDIVSIPSNHKGKDVHRDLIQRELRKVSLTFNDFLKALRKK